MNKKNYKPLISIIICTNNSEESIIENINSIKSQTYKNYEVVVVDNLSSDSTINIIKKKKFHKIKFVIEKDNGIYNAINKGIKISSGKIISILHSDDYYHDNNILNIITKSFAKNNVDLIYGNLIYVKKNNIKKKLRYWKSGKYIKNNFYKGWSPPHPTFICKKSTYLKGGFYKENIGNAADIELMHRYLALLNFKYKYINKTLITMRYGGTSNKNLKNIILQNFQILKFLNLNKNLIKVLVFFLYKIKARIKQFINSYAE